MNVYFDTECVLCNGFVQFLLKRDTEKLFKFGDYRHLYAGHRNKIKKVFPDSVVVHTMDGRYLYESDAVLYILSQLPGYWKYIRVLRIIPTGLRNIIYRFVAKYRYKAFGKTASCALPEPQWKDRFLNLSAEDALNNASLKENSI